MHVAVNIASSHFRQGGLIESVAQALRDSEALLESVRRPAVVTDAVAIIVGGGGR